MRNEKMPKYICQSMNVKANVFPMQYVLTPKRDSQIHVFLCFRMKNVEKSLEFQKISVPLHPHFNGN